MRRIVGTGWTIRSAFRSDGAIEARRPGALASSVLLKSSPLNNSGKPLDFDNA